jgi:hypothetical protein
VIFCQKNSVLPGGANENGPAAASSPSPPSCGFAGHGRKKPVPGFSYFGKTQYLHAELNNQHMRPANLPFIAAAQDFPSLRNLESLALSDLSGFQYLTGLSISVHAKIPIK